MPHHDWVVVDFPYGNEPSAIFTFKYRTRSMSISVFPY